MSRDATQLTVEEHQVVGIECEWCGQKVRLNAAQSIRPLARHFLSESLPFADCPHETCDQHGRNAFETLPRSGVRGGAYWQATAHDLRCTVCLADCPDEDCPNGPPLARRCPKGKACPNKPFPLGIALGLSERPKVRRSIDAIIHSVGEGRTVTDARASGIPVGSYYRRLQRLSARLGDYHAYRNAFLLKPGFCDQENRTAQVYTDVLQVSLNKLGETGRSQLLDVICSVVRLDRTFFVLAAHPYFLPDAKCPTLDDLVIDTLNPTLERHWHGVHSIMDPEPFLVEGKPNPALTDAGQPGMFMRSPYAEVAHFLVVQKMLSRFKRIHLHMDAAPDLYQSALVAMRGGIRAGRIDIAMFQFSKDQEDKKAAMEGARKRAKGDELERAFETVESDFEKRLAEQAKTPLGELGAGDDERLRAGLWVDPPRGANSTRGKWAWLDYPPDSLQYPRSRTLWVTRRQSDDLARGRDLLSASTLQPVDSAFASMRQRIASAQRPITVARGRGFKNSYYRADVVCAEFRIYLLRRNYCLRPGGPKDARVPAKVMGLADRPLLAKRLGGIASDFRLGVDEARQISAWMNDPGRTPVRP